ncbi:MAG TPA: DUF4331 domain-containing protein [Nakamurella sp.]
MSSHREAPEISKDPVADNTDTYAFVSPDRPDTVTIISNYIPLEDPAGGPNFFEFGDDVLYRININNSGDARADIVYEFRFETTIRNENTFLYNTGPIKSLGDINFNRPQTMTVTEVRGDHRRVLGKKLPTPPCNIGIRSTPNYPALADAAIADVGDGIRVFAGPRLDGFYVDLGSVFDLAALRPFQSLHLIPTKDAAGVNALRAFNVHTIAIQVPIKRLTRDASTPKDVTKREAVLGVWASAHRQKGRYQDESRSTTSGPFAQVSRLGNPLFNEVIVPMSRKDKWNRLSPAQDSQFAKYVAQPELARLLPVLYPGVFPNLAALKADRADLLAILLTGLPGGLVPGFQNYTGRTQADMLRLNVAIPPSTAPKVNGVIAGDLAGFPNGRRVFDNVVAIELRAVAGALYPLVDKNYKPDDAAGLLFDLVDGNSGPPPSVTYLNRFPYLDHPVGGYQVQPLSVAS